MSDLEQTVRFYASNYELLGQWLVCPGDKVVLGDPTQPRRCRFCGKSPPGATFHKQAHAIPEALGNKSIESLYECDACNQAFGSGIENDLGNWTQPMRAFARIRGKRGVPTLARGGSGGWRVEYDQSVMAMSANEMDSRFVVDEANKRLSAHVVRDVYTPVAVLKALTKIALTLMPEEEVGNFREAMAWMRHPDHSMPFISGKTVLHSFQPGPMPPDLLCAFLLRRLPDATGVPYCFLVLGYGNEVLQVLIPSARHDGESANPQVPAFRLPAAQSDVYGPVIERWLDLSSSVPIREEDVTVTLGYESATLLTPGVGASSP